jgi:ribonuclease P protein component
MAQGKLISAVTRNTVKRHTREALRYLLPKMQAGLDIVIFLQYSPELETKNRINEILTLVFKLTGILR